MTKLRIVLALLVALVLPVAAEAFSDGCLPTPAPTPVPPVVAQNVSWGFGSSPDRLRFEIWRQPCLDGSGVALLLRASPLSPGPGYFCDGNLQVLQGGHQFNTVEAKDRADRDPATAVVIYIPETFALQVEPSGGVPFDEARAFTLVGVGGPQEFPDRDSRRRHASRPASPSRPSAAPPATPATRSASRCEIVNPGPPMLVELKTSARLPNGSVVTIQDGEGLLPSGVTVIPVFTGFVLPAGVPPGIYTIEAVLLDPDAGRDHQRGQRGADRGAVTPRLRA